MMITIFFPVIRQVFVLLMVISMCCCAMVQPAHANTVSDLTDPSLYLEATPFLKDGETPPNLEWLKLAEEINNDWLVQPIEENPATLVIAPKQGDLSKAKHILVPMGRRSSAFGTAITTSLNLFRSKELFVVLTIVNYNNIQEYGKALLEKSKSDQTDLIMPVGSIAADFVITEFAGETLPVVTNTAKDPVLMKQIDSYDRGSGTNIAFTTFSIPIETLKTYLLQLKPNLKNIGILYESFNESTVKTQVEPLVAEANLSGIQTLLYAVDDEDFSKETLIKLIPQALQDMSSSDPALSNSIFFVTGSASVFQEIETITNLSRNVVVVATLPDVVKEGSSSADLSIGVNIQSSAYVAALYVVDILSGQTKPGDLPVGYVTPPDVAINFLRTYQNQLKIPFDFFELASFIYDKTGQPVRLFGQNLIG
ncbi:MAG: ABC transporter substrate binding protein [Cyanobacteriota bacterium]|nr:ABC transporter substrate binding protein [Cyanobacteriota bacterium]